jgi:hypothetical protein
MPSNQMDKLARRLLVAEISTTRIGAGSERANIDCFPHNVLKSSGASPNSLITLASLNSPECEGRRYD